jgi:hypothetical protein
VLRRQLAIPKDLAQEAGTYNFAGVRRDNRASAVFMAEEMVTPSDTKNAESRLCESGNELEPVMRGARLMQRWSHAEFQRTPGHRRACPLPPGTIG